MLVSCPYCGSEEVELCHGSPTNPKALYKCKSKGCENAFFGHQAGASKRLGEKNE